MFYHVSMNIVLSIGACLWHCVNVLFAGVSESVSIASEAGMKYQVACCYVVTVRHSLHDQL